MVYPAARLLVGALSIVAFLLWSIVPVAAAGQPTPGAVSGIVTSQDGAVLLSGATVRIVDESGRDVATTVSGGDGRFRVPALSPGRYRLDVMLEGFRAASVEASVGAGQSVDLRLDLDVSAVEQTVVVSEGAPSAIAVSSPSSRSQSVDLETIEEMDGFRDAIPLLAGVFQTPTGLSIKGGRPTQSSLLLGGANVTDLASGAAPFRLPEDAVQSIDVLPNPYSVEFGRFSSGVTVLETRHGGDVWRARLNNFIPSVRTRRHQPLSILGIERFGPRFFVAGPLLKDRLSLSQSAEYRYEGVGVWSRPETDIKTSHALNTFTRVDANLKGDNRLKVTFNALMQDRSAVNLDTFTPPEVAAVLDERIGSIVISDVALLSDAMVLDSLVQGSRYSAKVGPSGPNPVGLDIAPAENSGRYFHSGHRVTGAYQWAESLSRFFRTGLGEHLLKLGADVLRTTFSGRTISAPVRIRRTDGTLARQLTFSGVARQQVTSTDFAAFVQDRWQPHARTLLEAGARLDRDGGLETINSTLRTGGVVALTKTGSRVLRGGVGLFYERTPSIVSAFRQFDVATDTRFAADGVTVIGSPARLEHRVADALETPRSVTWNIGYEHQTRGTLFWRFNYLERRGSHEFLVEPIQTAPARTDLVLSSRGHSRYRELEVSAHYALGEALQVDGSFTRSAAVGDLNAYSSFFDLLRAPLVHANEFTRLDADVPNRFVARVRYTPVPRWLIAPVIEFRSGAPYSTLDEFLDLVPERGRSRFPAVTIVDIRVDRQVKILKWEPWIGVRVYNALNAIDPTDVQRNITSSEYGSFFGGQPRQIRLQMRFN